MRLGINIGYEGASMDDVLDFVQHAEAVGIDSVWAAEAYGSDVVTVLSYLAAKTDSIKLGSGIMQIPGRTPANTAMTAMTLDHLSGGRLLLGLGVSGPQVVEGWHGVAYGKPLAKTREYVDIIRAILEREERLTHDGEHYQIPYRGEDATGQGKPLKSILHPLRADLPIYIAAIGPKNVRQTAEIADGWLAVFYSPEREEVFDEHVDAGLEAAGKSEDDFDIATTINVAVGDDVDACRDQVRPFLALYIGGMGSRESNFYNDLARRYGFEEAAEEVQDLYLDGKKEQAAAAIPDDLVDEACLVGPLDRVIDRLEAWKESRVSTLLLGTWQPEILEPLQEAVS